MQAEILPILLFVGAATVLAAGMIAVGRTLGPGRTSPVKDMPYESGVDPIHGARRRFDIRFHLVAITFLVFDVEILFLYPWAVAAKNTAGVQAAVDSGLVSSRPLVLGGLAIFLALMTLGLIYDWRKGLFCWR